MSGFRLATHVVCTVTGRQVPTTPEDISCLLRVAHREVKPLQANAVLGALLAEASFGKGLGL